MSASTSGRDGEVVLTLTLLQSALGSGLDLASAIREVGVATDSRALTAVGERLRGGDAWETAWAGAGPAQESAERALRAAWTRGISPVALLGAERDVLVYRARAAAATATGELPVLMVLPLVLCYLPAFALVGMVPMVVALAGGLMP